MAIFGGGDPSEALRSTADVTLLAQSQQALVDRADDLQNRRKRLASTAQDLQSRNAVEQTRLQQEVDGLKSKSAQLTKQLNAMLDKLAVSRQKRLELGCDKSLAADAKKFPNGLIPSKYLCPLPQKGGHRLRADAALAFYKMNGAYKRRFGRDMCVTDAYRSLSAQQSVYARRPGFAAVPGTSNHGKGQASTCAAASRTRAPSSSTGWRPTPGSTAGSTRHGPTAIPSNPGTGNSAPRTSDRRPAPGARRAFRRRGRGPRCSSGSGGPSPGSR